MSTIFTRRQDGISFSALLRFPVVCMFFLAPIEAKIEAVLLHADVKSWAVTKKLSHVKAKSSAQRKKVVFALKCSRVGTADCEFR